MARLLKAQANQSMSEYETAEIRRPLPKFYPGESETDWNDSNDRLINKEEDGHNNGETLKELIQNYLRYKTRQMNIGAYLFAIVVALYLVVAHISSVRFNYGWLLLFTTLIFLALLKRWLLEYRVKNGWFGNNEYEATELIRFSQK